MHISCRMGNGDVAARKGAGMTLLALIQFSWFLVQLMLHHQDTRTYTHSVPSDVIKDSFLCLLMWLQHRSRYRLDENIDKTLMYIQWVICFGQHRVSLAWHKYTEMGKQLIPVHTPAPLKLINYTLFLIHLIKRLAGRNSLQQAPN